MTDNEIIKALECVIGKTISCEECLYKSIALYPECRYRCANDALKLINRQKAEIGELKSEIEEANIIERENEIQSAEENKENAKMFLQAIKQAKSEAIKEFAERLKRTSIGLEIGDDKKLKMTVVSTVAIDNLVKEMTEVEE